MHLGGLTFREVCLRTWTKINEHEILTRAATISFYALAALVPFLALVITLSAWLLLPRQGSSACCCILTRRASEGNAPDPSLALRVGI